MIGPDDTSVAIDYLAALTTDGALGMFWYVIAFEVPRYMLSLVAFLMSHRAAAPAASRAWASQELNGRRRISVVVAGHNEENSIEACVRSLRAQSLPDLELVIVSDGSSDRMMAVASDLVRRGLADKAFATDVRCGKSAGVNLACRFATGDIIVNVDCDCSYDRYAIERIVEPFSDPAVGAVCGDIAPRNGSASIITAFQTIEYLNTISLGKRVEQMFNLVVCISGAFGAFRREALQAVGGVDVGGGEDLDLTMRLRRAGWQMRFAPEAICYTDVPTTSWALIRQRMRWERDAIRVRFRKHRGTISPFAPTFRPVEAIHQIDFGFFHVVLTVAFPIYLAFLYVVLAESAVQLLIAVELGLMTLDAIVFLCALVTTGRWELARYLLYVPGYSLFNGFLMRTVRLFAYIQEWIFDASRRDSYVPPRVSARRLW